VLFSFLATFFGVKATIKTPKETVDEINKGKSLIRFGDGEFGIYRGKDIHYQRCSAELTRCFEEIKRDFEEQGEACPYILGVPRRFMTIKGTELMKKRVYVSSWSQSRYDFKKNFNRNLPYGDSFLFEKGNKEIYSKIWTHSSCPENIIFVHNNEQYAEYFRDTYKKNTFFVKCPSRDSFEEIISLENEIRDVIKSNNWDKNQVMLTISAGPAGKVLVYKFSQEGYQCIDAGHCWDDPLEGI
jgi:hypothetical protein